jgi:hypothetical protein
VCTVLAGQLIIGYCLQQAMYERTKSRIEGREHGKVSSLCRSTGHERPLAILIPRRTGLPLCWQLALLPGHQVDAPVFRHADEDGAMWPSGRAEGMARTSIVAGGAMRADGRESYVAAITVLILNSNVRAAEQQTSRPS